MKRRAAYPRRITRAVIGGACLLAGLNFALAPPLDRANVVSTEVVDADGKWLSGFTVEDGRWRLATDLETLDPRFVTALIAIEDKRFWSHGGVDPLATARAAKSWAQRGQVVSGASTLTMQLARQLEPRPRNLSSKALESLRAAQIEMRLPKAKILEHYLTHAPYGGNLEGVRAASLSYFGKEPRHLTDAQIALLIALPQAPEARRPDLRPKAAQKARDLILDKLVAAQVITARQGEEAKEAPIPTARDSFKENGWLTAQRLSATSGDPRIETTLDGALQARLETLASGFADARDSDLNAAILVVDNETRQVRASVGSAGRGRPGGWIDMTTRKRSPGSTLKPFIYGLAFDDGIAAPGSTLLDAPTRFGTYQPQNFSKRYHGRVTVAQALQHSLNVPAVAALEQVGQSRFEASLRGTGIEMDVPKTPDGQTGLAIALGGVGVSAEGLGVLYSALANDGLATPLVWRKNEHHEAQYRIMSAQSAQRLTDIMRQSPTPPGRVPPWLTRAAPPIAYKTGTSYGFRDAWAAGYTDSYTVIVWTGRADGAPIAGQTGRTMAAPLMYDVFAQLSSDDKAMRYARMDKAPTGLTQLTGTQSDVPLIIYPPDKAEIAVRGLGKDGRGVSLAARSETRTPLNWFVDGMEIPAEPRSGRVVWKPNAEGFYKITVVNETGTTATSNVRVMALD